MRGKKKNFGVVAVQYSTVRCGAVLIVVVGGSMVPVWGQCL